MRGPAWTRGVAALAVWGALALVGAAGAPAAETIGQTATADDCGSNQTLVQRQTAGAQTHQAQTSGVVVSWSYRAVNNPPNLRLRIYRATGSATTWFVRSETAQKVPGAGADNVKANTLNTFSERPGIRIEAGDVLGLTGQGGNGISCADTGNTANKLAVRGSDAPVGQESGGYVVDALFGRLGVQAVIEPDADGDGLGDESQDGCPGDAEAGGACPDADGDSFIDKQDPCPNDSDTASPRSPRNGCPSDNDGDGTFDQADPDDDNDGVLDADDKHPLDPTKYLTDPTAGNDTIDGTAANDTICGLGGHDTLNGLGGNDILWGDACNDRLRPLFGAQTGTDGDDLLNGGDGDDALFGAGGNDSLKGGNGRDKLVGGEGKDKLDGGAGKDGLDGGSGNDKLVGGTDTNSYKAGSGNDSISARNGKKENVDCGKGSRDKATVDRNDKVKNCETVKRPK